MSSHSFSRPSLRTRDIWLLLAAAWFGLLLTAAGCRDTREDTNFCKSCTAESTASSDAGATSSQESAQSMSSSSSAPPNMSQASGVSMGSAATSSAQAGGAVPKGGAGSGASGASTAGNRAATAGSGASTGAGGTAMSRGGSSGSADEGGRGAAANGGIDTALDAGMAQEPPQRDAGHMEPLPCNGACPPDRPVCDESKPTPQCVQCTSDDNHACVGDTKVCDGTARKCVQCTVDDVSGCEGEATTCNRSNRCVRCTADQVDSCPPTQHVCDNETRCVECMTGKVDSCPFGRELCSTDGRCIECTDNTRCPDSALARCDRQSNSCVGCEDDNDCSDRFPATPHCDKSSRRCVVCTTDGAPTCGPGMFCDANTHTCAPGSPTRMNCAPCDMPQDCAQSPEIAVCAESNNKRYCFAAPVGGACQTGYIAQPVPNHQSTPYCLPRNTSSCEAINNALMAKPCSKSEECGKNGMCIVSAGTCSLQCNDAQECPLPLVCAAGACTKM